MKTRIRILFSVSEWLFFYVLVSNDQTELCDWSKQLTSLLWGPVTSCLWAILRRILRYFCRLFPLQHGHLNALFYGVERLFIIISVISQWSAHLPIHSVLDFHLPTFWAILLKSQYPLFHITPSKQMVRRERKRERQRERETEMNHVESSLVKKSAWPGIEPPVTPDLKSCKLCRVVTSDCSSWKTNEVQKACDLLAKNSVILSPVSNTVLIYHDHSSQLGRFRTYINLPRLY